MALIKTAHFILYVADQTASTLFYERVLESAPRLNVPGMTEFELRDGVILGVMPGSGIRRLLGAAIADPQSAAGIARAELYLVVDDARRCHERALNAGAIELSPVLLRDWGHEVGYVRDPDGHVLAFASEPAALQI